MQTMDWLGLRFEMCIAYTYFLQVYTITARVVLNSRIQSFWALNYGQKHKESFMLLIFYDYLCLLLQVAWKITQHLNYYLIICYTTRGGVRRGALEHNLKLRSEVLDPPIQN